MATMIDAGVFSGAYNIRDKYHEQAVKLLEDALTGKYTFAYTTDYIFDEAITLTLYRTKKPELAIKLGEAILGSTRIKIVIITYDMFQKAWNTFKKHKGVPISFTDATTIEAMRANDITLLMSFDKDFDKIPQITRISQE